MRLIVPNMSGEQGTLMCSHYDYTHDLRWSHQNSVVKLTTQLANRLPTLLSQFDCPKCWVQCRQILPKYGNTPKVKIYPIKRLLGW